MTYLLAKKFRSNLVKNLAKSDLLLSAYLKSIHYILPTLKDKKIHIDILFLNEGKMIKSASGLFYVERIRYCNVLDRR